MGTVITKLTARIVAYHELNGSNRVFRYCIYAKIMS